MRKSPYKLVHQKVALHIDLFKKTLTGYVELTVVTLSKRLETLPLNCRQAEISSVTVNGINAEYTLKNFLDQTVASAHGKTDEETFKTFYRASLQASDAGELLVKIPEAAAEVRVDGVPPESSGTTLKVCVNYSITAPRAGAYFVLPSDAYPKRRAHMYTHNATNDVRMWMPCIDNFNERPTWEMEYTVSAQDKNLIVVSTGELRSQILSEDETLKTFYFAEDVPTTARAVLLAVGPFEVLPDEVGFDPKISVTHFCLPGRMPLLRHSVQFLAGAYKFFSTYLSSDLPYKSYKQVFVEDTYSKLNIGASMSIISTHILHPPDVIDQTFETRRLLSLALIQQWFGAFIGIKDWPDCWIQFGLAGFMASLYFRQMFGNNEFKFRLANDMEYVCQSPENKALYCTNFTAPIEFFHKIFFKKSVLIMYLMERRLGTDGFKKVLASLLMPTKSGSMTPPHLALSTQYFLKFVKKLTGFDMKEFAERWVYSVGCPHFVCGFWFDKIRYHTEIAVKQQVEENRPKIGGTLNVRLVEMDQEAQHRYFQHALNIEDEVHVFEFPCHSRPRRIRSGANTPGGATVADVTSALSRKNGADDPDSDDDDPANMSSAAMVEVHNTTPLQWLRFDPHMDWVMSVSFRQPQFMWINQLQHDKDILAQLDAIRNLQLFPNKDTMDVLDWALCHPQLYYRVRMRAALTMSILTNASNNWIGLDKLYDFFKTNFFFTDPLQVKPNDFENFSNAFQQKAVAFALSLVRGQDGKTPSDVINFLVHLLKNNDNSHNPWSDNYYLAAVIHALANLNSGAISAGIPLDPKIEQQITRYLNMEKMMPSYQNSITCACLAALCQMQRQGKMDKTISIFQQHLKYGNYRDVRVTALRAIIALNLGGGKDDAESTTEAHTTLTSLLNLIEDEPCIWMKWRLVATLVEPRDILSATAKVWDLADPIVESFLILDAVPKSSSVNIAATTGSRVAFPKEVQEAGSRLLRHRFRKFQSDSSANVALRSQVWTLANSSKTSQDSRLRLAMIKLYTLIGGEHNTESQLPPRPKLPTHPINKKKIKRERMKLAEVKKRKRAEEEQEGSAKRQKTGNGATPASTGDVAVQTAPLKAKIKLPKPAPAPAANPEPVAKSKKSKNGKSSKAGKEGGEVSDKKSKSKKKHKHSRKNHDAETGDIAVDNDVFTPPPSRAVVSEAPATANIRTSQRSLDESLETSGADDSHVQSSENLDIDISTSNLEDEPPQPAPKKKRPRAPRHVVAHPPADLAEAETAHSPPSDGPAASRPPRRNAALASAVATAKHVSTEELDDIVVSDTPPMTTMHSAPSVDYSEPPPMAADNVMSVETVKSGPTKLRIKLRPGGGAVAPISPRSPPREYPPIFPNLKRIVLYFSGFDPRQRPESTYTAHRHAAYIEEPEEDIDIGEEPFVPPPRPRQEAINNNYYNTPTHEVHTQYEQSKSPNPAPVAEAAQPALPKLKIRFKSKGLNT